MTPVRRCRSSRGEPEGEQEPEAGLAHANGKTTAKATTTPTVRATTTIDLPSHPSPCVQRPPQEAGRLVSGPDRTDRSLVG